MRWMSFLAGAALLSGLLCACEPETEIVEGSAEDHGKALFSDPTLTETSANAFSCATCHPTSKPSADGPILPGAPLAGVTRRASYWGGMELELLRSMNHCLYYFMLSSKSWSAEDERAGALFAYLDALPAGSADEEAWPFTVPVQVSAPPPGDATAGASVYSRACKNCHGAVKTGDGRLVARAPVLPDQTLAEHPLGTYTPEQRRLVFVQKTRHGGFLGYGGQMPPFSLEVLSDEQMGDLLAYMGVP
ncbi:c-type cytochrome [Polyangium sorediatum]|uniref:C-type cytochrome n=1 Tax=Polyangium sorediatum TaxID=889274 RepID=A0ABT6NRK3_9BACT|nr:c-type cytochrome [Polyangium sorediatum]MDI1430906.1 c-type cytochrome [Polyangium sorediatum]